MQSKRGQHSRTGAPCQPRIAAATGEEREKITTLIAERDALSTATRGDLLERLCSAARDVVESDVWPPCGQPLVSQGTPVPSGLRPLFPLRLAGAVARRLRPETDGLRMGQVPPEERLIRQVAQALPRSQGCSVARGAARRT
jgi:hypothetical protein